MDPVADAPAAAPSERVEVAPAADAPDPDVVDTDTVEMAGADGSEPDTDIETETASVRQADSHVHGAASLAMALDGGTLSVELETPLYNILGFEHAPDTPEQTRAVTEAQTVLADPSRLFAFNAEAGCTVTQVPTVVLFGEDDDHSHDHDDEHGHEDDHDHADEHSHDADHAHDDDHDHDHDHEDGHAHRDVILGYAYDCANPEALRAVDLPLFTSFEELTTLDLVYLGNSQQMASSISRDGDRRAELDG